MNKRKTLVMILSISILLAAAALRLYLLDPSFVPDLYRVSSMTIAVSWAFFIAPAVMFLAQAVKRRWGSLPQEQAFREGAFLGIMLGFGGTVVLCLLLSPVAGTLWYIQTIRGSAASGGK